MRPLRLGLLVVGSLIIGASVGVAAVSYDSPARKEQKRADLSGAPGMEVISSMVEFKKGDFIAVHVHHGIETNYVVQGSMVQAPGKDPMMLATGSVGLNLRDAPHAGFKVVGDEPLKIFTVHIVDKGKPLYDWVK
jgi:quercetin dioxygenase-like cupin family protein